MNKDYGIFLNCFYPPMLNRLPIDIRCLELVDHLLQLFAETDGIALGNEDDSIERVGNDENGEQTVGLEFHLGCDLALNTAVAVDAEDSIGWQFTEILGIKFGCVGFIFK